MMDRKKTAAFMNDIRNLTAAERELDDFIGTLRSAQMRYRNSMDQLSSWRAGEATRRANQWYDDFFSELSKNIHRLEDNRYEIIETKKRLNALMQAEINSGPKW